MLPPTSGSNSVLRKEEPCSTKLWHPSIRESMLNTEDYTVNPHSICLCSLFNDALSNSHCRPIALNECMLMNNELEAMWKEAAVAWFKALSRHLPGTTERTQGTPQSGQSVFRPRFKPNTFWMQIGKDTAWGNFPCESLTSHAEQWRNANSQVTCLDDASHFSFSYWFVPKVKQRFLFICSLFNDALSRWNFYSFKLRYWMAVNNELERMQKETIVS
jgi:hypothetical protein